MWKADFAEYKNKICLLPSVLLSHQFRQALHVRFEEKLLYRLPTRAELLPVGGNRSVKTIYGFDTKTHRWSVVGTCGCALVTTGLATWDQDANGLVYVRRGCEKMITSAVETVRSRERRLMDWVRSDKFNLDGFRDHVVK